MTEPTSDPTLTDRLRRWADDTLMLPAHPAQVGRVGRGRLASEVAAEMRMGA